ncbi:MAG: phenylalanine--tRNA ligase subunit beta [Flavobacteriaceae bacterium]|nr:phenylalanine--tRNA ligase subunit beta [Flavobacteriaceae bacterium]|tara:strand:+ start:266 stop:2692 length:2427 start_codon:yes stop_codon:yes gene_type:complete
MKISYNWLKQFINIDWTPEKTSELLTNLGLEVEGIEAYASIKGGLKGIVVGEVKTCEKHPNADRLKLTTVNVGDGQILKIVCGAPNVAVGQKVAVATIGTTLYTAEGEPWKIKKGKIRGEESYGMLCAEDELGLGPNHDGIMILDKNLTTGSPLSENFNIENDIVFDIGLTPNRADAMSHYGTARDLKAGLIQEGLNPELMSPSVSGFHVDNRTLKIDVVVEAKDKAARYCGITISGVKIEASPDWMQQRLKAIGLSPINNIVDITNYVLHSLGQPLHVFDADEINGQKVIVRNAKKSESFTTLDGIKRNLDPEDLIICNIDSPMCLAGVFGGLDSGVKESTKNIFLESAHFDAVSIRKTAKRHGLYTDASFRFERGIDPNITKYALKYAATLISEIAGGEISSDLIDEYPKKIKDKQVFLSFESTNKLIGQEIPKETVKQILSSLEIKVNSVTEAGLGLTIPAFRIDVEREIDVIEEILRVYGYNNIESRQKLNTSISNISKHSSYKIENSLANHLVSLGFFEIINNSLTNNKYSYLVEKTNNNKPIEILNPLSNELSVLRTSMLFSGLETILYNLNRQQNHLKLFEFGKTYHLIDGNNKEFSHLSILMLGTKTTTHWKKSNDSIDFFYVKGIALTLLEKIGLSKTKFTYQKSHIFSEGQTLNIGGKNIVDYGIVKKSITQKFDIEQVVYYINFNWIAVLDSLKSNNIKFSEIPKFPIVKRDFALLIDKEISFESIYKIAKETDKKILKDINLFDVYNGSNLPKGKKSYAVSFTLQNMSKTLNEKEIEKVMLKLQKRLENKLGAELR